MKYRSDIDGLRAVAVLSVILSHAGFTAFAGGFVGVDVFFVISGFLITRILTDDMQRGTYSLTRFYERRARRILPALIFVIVVSYPFAWLLMLPDFLQNFGQSVVATLLFANNLLLAKTSGYWALESGFKPLLHTWSLGVEEQFYIVFPVLLALVWRFGKRVQIGMIVVVGLASFALAEHGWRTDPAVSFYLPTTRAWELMIGCAAAYFPRRDSAADDLLSAIGLAAILVSVLFFSETTPSPSYYTALPVVGSAAILLFSRPGTIAFRILSIKPFVFVGLISYSAYLWHQPIFALARVASLEPPSPWVFGLLGLVSLGLAWLTWRFVEQPFRQPRVVPLRIFAPVTATASAALIASGVFLHIEDGLPRRIFPNVADASDVYISYNERIRRYSTDAFPDNGKANVLLIGNSFGRDVANLLIENGSLDNSNLAYVASMPQDFASGIALPAAAKLLPKANLVVISIQTGEPELILAGIDDIRSQTTAPIIVFGPKQFGNNLNPFGRVPMAERPQVRSNVAPEVAALNETLRKSLGTGEFVDMLALFGEDGRSVAVFDAEGNPLSPDRIHLTRYGALFAGEKLKEERPDVIARFATGQHANAD